MGVFLLLVVFLNVSAWNAVGKLNTDVTNYVHQYEEAVHANDLEGIAAINAAYAGTVGKYADFGNYHIWTSEGI